MIYLNGFLLFITLLQILQFIMQLVLFTQSQLYSDQYESSRRKLNLLWYLLPATIVFAYLINSL